MNISREFMKRARGGPTTSLRRLGGISQTKCLLTFAALLLNVHNVLVFFHQSLTKK